MASPLSKADLAQCKAGQYECHELEKEVDKAQACGLDCAEQALRLAHLKQFFQAILEQYSPPMGASSGT